MRRRIVITLMLIAGFALVPATTLAQEDQATLIVRVRDDAGQPVVGIGVHVYAAEYEAVAVVGDQTTDDKGTASFSVRKNGSYSVALYSPPGMNFELLPEELQTLTGIGEDGLGGMIGIGVVMGERDYTLRLVLKDGQPFYDSSFSDEEPPAPFVPGVTDKDWPTPTPYVLSTAEPTAAGQPTPAAAATVVPTAHVGAVGQRTISSGSIEPTPFPWLSVLVVGGVFGLAWIVYRTWSAGKLQGFSLPGLLWRRRQSSSEHAETQEEH